MFYTNELMHVKCSKENTYQRWFYDLCSFLSLINIQYVKDIKMVECLFYYYTLHFMYVGVGDMWKSTYRIFTFIRVCYCVIVNKIINLFLFKIYGFHIFVPMYKSFIYNFLLNELLPRDLNNDLYLHLCKNF